MIIRTKDMSHQTISFSSLNSNTDSWILGNDLIINDDRSRQEDYSPEELAPFQSVSSKAEEMFGITICWQGEMQVDWGNGEFTLHKGDGFFLQSGTLGGLKQISAQSRSIGIFTNERFFSPNLSSAEAAIFTSEVLKRPYFTLNEEQFQNVVSIIEMMEQVLNDRDHLAYVRRMLHGMTQMLTFLCLSIYHSQMEVVDTNFATQHDNNIFHRFLSLVQQNYSQHPDISFYADQLCISPKYLSRLVYLASGIHAGDHIDNYRINEAKSLLRTGQYNINEVSERLNFNSPSHFCRYFKKFTGMTPLTFRNSK